jgi:Ethylbenzene dehydrogenase
MAMRLKVMMSLTKRRLRQACGACFQFFVRKDKLTNPDDKALNEGKVYNFSFAVHDDNITTRGHHVSFPVTVGFGAKAAIEATKLK